MTRLWFLRAGSPPPPAAAADTVLRLSPSPPHLRRVDDAAEVDMAAVVEHIFEADVVVVQ